MCSWLLMSIIKSNMGFLCPILSHDEMQDILYRRHKLSYSDP